MSKVILTRKGKESPVIKLAEAGKTTRDTGGPCLPKGHWDHTQKTYRGSRGNGMARWLIHKLASLQTVQSGQEIGQCDNRPGDIQR